MDDGLIERSREFTENFAYDINLVRGIMRKMANALEAQQSEIASLRGALEHDVREVAEALSIEAQLSGQSISEENRLRAKMGDCARTLIIAVRAALTVNTMG